MKIETFSGEMYIIEALGQQSLTVVMCEYITIRLWHNGIRQLYHAIKKRETGIVTTCDKLPEVFVTENLSTIDVRRHTFHLSKTRSGNLRIGSGPAVNNVVLTANGESDLTRLLNDISLKDIIRDRDPSLDDIWYDW